MTKEKKYPCKSCPTQVKLVCERDNPLCDRTLADVAHALDRADVETRRERSDWLLSKIKEKLTWGK